MAEPVRSAVPVRVGGGEGGGAEGAAAGRHAAEDAAPRYSVSSESQGVGATEPLGQKCPKGQMVVAFAAVPGEGQKKPAGQLSHNDEPLALKVPAAHIEHDVPYTKVGHKSQYTLPLKSWSK